MLESLKVIQSYREGNEFILNQEKWLYYLVNTSEVNVNYERLNSLKDVSHNFVLNYVEKTLWILNEITDLTDYQKKVIEEVLKWSEVAKCGSSLDRRTWIEKGFNLFAHNLGSADIFQSHFTDDFYYGDNLEVIYTLIRTHGLLGQTLKGEVLLKENASIFNLKGKFSNEDDLHKILYNLNYCIISGISQDLWNNIEKNVLVCINKILSGQFEEYSMEERLLKLRHNSILEGEDFVRLYKQLKHEHPSVITQLEVLSTKTFWYVDAALSTFNFSEFIKTLLIISRFKNIHSLEHIDFSSLMREIHYDYRGQKQINIYKKRIIENLLASYSYEDILTADTFETPHLYAVIEEIEHLAHGQFNFAFSLAANKLIDFCEVAENTDSLYEKAIILLYDLFGLRRDEFDRLHNESDYLSTMNQNIDDKSKILHYVTGDNVLDIGPGGGVMLDLVEEQYPDKKVFGIDIAENVIQELSKKKVRENHSWEVLKGDAFQLNSHFKEGEIDTIIFSSVLHELFSFVPYEGKKFNTNTIKAALSSSFNILSSGGRIIIRDGIMSEPVNEWKIIRFKNKEDMDIFKRYVQDFKGREIQYEILSSSEVKLPINDAMEFLFTYTWGEDAYHHEVKEQFGYFTPTEYKEAISDLFGDKANILTCEHYLQTGYEEFLLPKVDFLNADYSTSRLPDSTCFIIIEKK